MNKMLWQHFINIFSLFIVLQIQYQLVTCYNSSFINSTKVNRIKRDGNYNDGLPNEFTLELLHKSKIELIKFVRVNRKLANEHLPVFIASRDSNNPHLANFAQHKYVMDEIGPFALYENTYLDASVIYFGKLGLLNGYIGNRFIINGLPWTLRNHADTHIPYYIIPRDMINNRQPSVPVKQNENIGLQAIKNIMPPQQTPQVKQFSPIYPELLIVIDYDLYNQYLHTPVPNLSVYGSLVYKILTKIHAADMIFQQLSNPEIYLNIAAIIAEVDSRGLGIFKKESVTTGSNVNTRADIPNDEMLKRLQSHFYGSSDTFLQDSYDIVMVMTRQELSSMNEIKRELTFATSRSIIEFRKKPCPSIPFAVFVQVKNDFDDVTAIARGVGKVLSTKYNSNNNGSPTNNSPIDPCKLNVINSEPMCKSCSKWNDNFIDEIHKFSESKNVCAFLNTPRSLFSSGPRVILSKKEQCKCYGYANVIDNGDVMCQNPIKCSNSQSQNDLPLPFDGTPCAHNKVCWNTECVRVSS